MREGSGFKTAYSEEQEYAGKKMKDCTLFHVQLTLHV